MKELILQLNEGRSLDADAIARAVEHLLSVSVPTEEKKNFLLALHDKGETPGEIAGFVRELLRHAKSPCLSPTSGKPRIDVCGTGGDKAGYFNVSTGVMFVLAALGAEVVKHGNRGITSRSGGADVLEALGVPLHIPEAEAGSFLDACGFVFFFAPQYHPAFKEIAPVRKELASMGRTSIFNILGPLLNPARPEHQLVGVFHPELLGVFCEVLHLLGRKTAWVVHGTIPGAGALDELSLFGPSQIRILEAGNIRSQSLSPADLTLPPGRPEELLGGSPEENAEILLAILENRDQSVRRAIVEVNAAAAACACGLAHDLVEARQLAAEAITTGRARQLLETARNFPRQS